MMTAIDVLKAHGSKNDIFIIEGPPEDIFAAAELTQFVQRLCDRSGPLGGDGVYFVDARSKPATAAFFNPDGSAAAFCGNGMRAVGRVLLDRCGLETATVRSDGIDFTVRRADPTPEGVAQIVVELPPVDFAPLIPIVADGTPHIAELMPALHSSRHYTALAVPNSHLVSVADRYCKAELVEAGERVAANPHEFPIGANVSHVLPLAEAEMFVHTYERGAGLTMSCGSGVVASRAVCSRLGLFAPDERVVVRNPGGVSRAWLRAANGGWLPSLEGNASFVYRATIDSSLLMKEEPVSFELDGYTDEIDAFGSLDELNLEALRSSGVAVLGA
jgi:diaminopimelate epimerase